MEPVLRYPGSKARLAERIVALMPPHTAYVEPFFGSGIVLMRKPRVRTETVNDIDRRVVTYFRMLRDRPVELAAAVSATPYARDELADRGDPSDDLEVARRFAVECWQSREGFPREGLHWRRDLNDIALAGTWARLPEKVLAAAERMQGVQIENCDALEIIQGSRRKGTLLYVDPPYLGRDLYGTGLTYEGHVALLEAVNRHPGPVVLSGRESLLYDTLLADWQAHYLPLKKLKNVEYDEIVWVKE